MLGLLPAALCEPGIQAPGMAIYSSPEPKRVAICSLSPTSRAVPVARAPVVRRTAMHRVATSVAVLRPLKPTAAAAAATPRSHSTLHSLHSILRPILHPPAPDPTLQYSTPAPDATLRYSTPLIPTRVYRPDTPIGVPRERRTRPAAGRVSCRGPGRSHQSAKQPGSGRGPPASSTVVL